MATKVHSDRKPGFETIYYAPLLQSTGDCEGATRVINAVTEPAVHDYNSPLTLPDPNDARIQVLRIGARLSVTIDSLNGGCTRCYCRVYVDTQDADHLLFDLSFTTAANQLAAVTTHASNKAAIFNLLKDGAAHTFRFFFWVDAGNAVLSVVQLWEGVGGNDGSYVYPVALKLVHTGHCDMIFVSNNVLSGASAGYVTLYPDSSFTGTFPLFLRQDSLGTGVTTSQAYGGVIVNNPGIGFHLAAATNLGFIYKVLFILRSEN